MLRAKLQPRPEVVYVFERSGETWTATEKLHNLHERELGYQGVALSEDGDAALIREGSATSRLTTTWRR